jgi:carboxypeptidase A2
MRSQGYETHKGSAIPSLDCTTTHSQSVVAPIMKTTILASALLLTTALGSVVPKAPKKIDYSGFKVLRVASTDDVKAQIESLAAHVLNSGKSAELDIVVSPENVDALTALVAESTVLNEDVGAALVEEGQMSAYAGLCSTPTCACEH